MSVDNDSKPSGAGQPDTGKTQPPASNTGVSGKNQEGFYYSLDWLRYSAPHGGKAQEYVIEHPAFALSGEVLKPAPYYNQVVGFNAARVEWHSERVSQSVLVTMNGQDCQYAVSQGVRLLDVLFHAIYTLLGKFTRVDFAVDVFMPGVSPQDIETAWNGGKVSTAAQSCNSVRSRGQNGADMGQTVYIGSRSSGRLLRVYDKAKQAGVDGPWLRIELECKAEYAQAFAASMLLSGDIIQTGKAYINEFIQIEGLQWFNDALVADGGAWLEPIERKETNRQRWYREQIIPAIERDMMTGSRTGQWLVQELFRLLDYAQEVEQHGGTITPIKNSNKAFYGVLVLQQNEGYSGPEFRRAFEVAGKDFIIETCRRLGYKWDTKKQRWFKKTAVSDMP